MTTDFIAELEDAVDKKKRVLEALRRNPNLLKQFRPILEETLEEKLENMGVKRVNSMRERKQAEIESALFPFYPFEQLLMPISYSIKNCNVC